LSDYNPYTPPQQDDDALRSALGGPGGASWDGKALTVPKLFSFPRICLKCASPEVHSRRLQNFAFTPTWARMLVLFCWPGAVVAMAITTKRATLDLPLCDPCHARWASARKWNILLMLGAIVGIIGVVFGSSASRSDEAGLFVGVAVLAVVLGIAFGVRKLVRPHLLQAQKIDNESISLLGVYPSAGEQVARASGAR
jgi:hypothetical protein